MSVEGESEVADERLLLASEVALLFQVSTRTVNEWTRRGLIPCIRTPGGRLRYQSAAIRRFLAERWSSIPPS